MPNLLQYLRMRNIFAPQAPIGNDLPSQGGFAGQLPIQGDGSMAPMPTKSQSGPWFQPDKPTAPTPGMPDQPTADDYDPTAELAKLYHPDTSAEDRFNKIFDAYPNRENYHPSAMRRIGGALISFGSGMTPGRGLDFYNPNVQGVKAGMDYMDEPFNEARADWKDKIQPAEYGANLERQANSNERLYANQVVTQQQRDRKLAQDAKIAEAKQDNANARTEVYRFKAHHPGVKFDYHGPTVTYADPQTGKVFDTGVKTGRLSDSDKIDLNQDNAIERIDETGDQARQTEQTRQTGREALQNIKGWTTANIPDPNDPTKTIGVRVNQDTGEVKRIQLEGKDVGAVARPSSGSGSSFKAELPTQTLIRQYDNAREVFNTRPDLRPFIKLGNPGAHDFNIRPPSDSKIWGHSGPTKEQAAELQSLIYGDSSPVLAQSHRTSPFTDQKPNIPIASGAISQAAPPAVPQGRVVIYDKKGNAVGHIPVSQIEQAKAQGFVVH